MMMMMMITKEFLCFLCHFNSYFYKHEFPNSIHIQSKRNSSLFWKQADQLYMFISLFHLNIR